MDAPVLKYVLITLEGNINPGYMQELKMYLKLKKDKDKEAEKKDVSVSNSKDIIDHFLIIAKNMAGDALNSWYKLGQVQRTFLGR